jgi:hypothetical protein
LGDRSVGTICAPGGAPPSGVCEKSPLRLLGPLMLAPVAWPSLRPSSAQSKTLIRPEVAFLWQGLSIPISDDQVVQLLPVLVEAARASQRTTQRFVPPRTGIVEEAASRRHQFVHGRRGVGKSTLLRVVEQRVSDTGGPVAFIDLETLRGVPYPDVLIQLLIELLEKLAERLSVTSRSSRIRDRLSYQRQQRRLRGLRKSLNRLLAEPQSAEHVVRQLQSRAKAAGGDVSLGVVYRSQELRARGSRNRSSAEQTELEARFTRTKMEGLFAAAPLIRSILRDVMSKMEGTAGLIVLDDFYHIRRADQPEVLAYLHQIVKNLELYLKICGVRHRLNPFIEGDPPTGLQVGQDAGQISLDVTLQAFDEAQGFLEAVLNGVGAPLGVRVDELVTPGGRQRLVLGSGGVARDYLNPDHSSECRRRASWPEFVRRVGAGGWGGDVVGVGGRSGITQRALSWRRGALNRAGVLRSVSRWLRPAQVMRAMWP